MADDPVWRPLDHYPEDDVVSSFRPIDDAGLLALIAELAGSERPLVAVDGRSGGGKSTFARRLAALLGADLVATDDVAWYHSFFGWDELLDTQVIAPWRAGDDVSFRPQSWDERGRPGAITARSDRPLVMEGVGAARPSLRDMADVVVWVQSDRAEAHRRGIARDVADPAVNRDQAEAEQFWAEWEAQEEPFQSESKPWLAAHLIVRGAVPGARTDDPVFIADQMAAQIHG